MEIVRFVVTGPVGAGKTTFIRSISEIEVVDTDRQATDEVALLKDGTTVALDFGRLQFSPDMALHLYGTPGQARFDFMWDILIRKADAYIVLVPANRPSTFREARSMLNFMRQRSNAPVMIGLTHTDSPEAWDQDSIALSLGYTDLNCRPPIINVNATDSASVSQAVISLVQTLVQASAVH